MPLPPTISPQKPPTSTPHTHTTTHDFIGAYFIQIPPSTPGSNKKIMLLLKFNFREILFYKYWKILKKYLLQVLPQHPQLSI